MPGWLHCRVYRLRVSSDLQHSDDSSPWVMTSIPARCWASGRWAAPLVLHMLTDGRAGGISFEMHCERGPGANSSESMNQALAALATHQIPTEMYVQLRWPTLVPELRPPLSGAFGECALWEQRRQRHGCCRGSACGGH